MHLGLASTLFLAAMPIGHNKCSDYMKVPRESARAVEQNTASHLAPGTSRLGLLAVASGSYISGCQIRAHRLTLVELPPRPEAACAAECLEGVGI